MPVQINVSALRAEARRLIGTGRVPPLRMTALFLAISLALDLVRAAAGFLLGADSLPWSASFSLPFSFLDILITLLGVVLSAGFAGYCLWVHRGREMPYDALFDAFPFAGKVVLLELIEGFAIGAGLMFFLVPGVLAALTYMFAILHLCEDPSISPVEAMRRSRLETRGHRWELFTVLLSFLPLLLLAAMATGAAERLLHFPETLSGALLETLVVGLIAAAPELYLLPYFRLTLSGFYRCLQGEDRPETA